MNRTLLFLALILLSMAEETIYAQTATDNKQQYASIGNFNLENGQQIVDCKIGYRTFGTLNASRTNAILYLTPGGTTTYMLQLFGATSQVDTNKFYLILIDAFGNGVSSSPSNSLSQPKTSFPQFNIRDMVNAQQNMLVENMNIHHITGVIGGSVGGLQALQWAVSYPDFMDKVVAIETSPKLSAYDLLWMQTYIEAVKSDTAYHNGDYTSNPKLTLSTHLSQLLLTSPEYLNSGVNADSLSSFLAMLEKNPFKVDANNMIWQTKATMMHDITAKSGGSLESAAKKVKAEMLIVSNKQDRTINQSLSLKFAELTKAELLLLDNDLGHLVFGEKNVIEATRKFYSQ